MKFINALSSTSDCNKWVANSRHPRILHVFDHACNLINEHREVLSIVTPYIGNGPFNLVIEEDVLFSKHLYAQSPIYIDGNQLHLGALTITTDKVKPWSPHPNWERLHVNRDHILDQLTKLPGIQSSVANFQFSNSLLFSLAFAELTPSLITAQKLAGLGIGLTPAGDDFIMGAIYAAWIIHPPEVARALAEGIANIAMPLTTSLSTAWLKSASKGEAGILWHEFFDRLIDADTVRIRAAMDKILAVGETSGADALAGFIGTFISYAECETRICHS